MDDVADDTVISEPSSCNTSFSVNGSPRRAPVVPKTRPTVPQLRASYSDPDAGVAQSIRSPPGSVPATPRSPRILSAASTSPSFRRVAMAHAETQASGPRDDALAAVLLDGDECRRPSETLSTARVAALGFVAAKRPAHVANVAQLLELLRQYPVAEAGFILAVRELLGASNAAHECPAPSTPTVRPKTPLSPAVPSKAPTSPKVAPTPPRERSPVRDPTPLPTKPPQPALVDASTNTDPVQFGAPRESSSPRAVSLSPTRRSKPVTSLTAPTLQPPSNQPVDESASQPPEAQAIPLSGVPVQDAQAIRSPRATSAIAALVRPAFHVPQWRRDTAAATLANSSTTDAGTDERTVVVSHSRGASHSGAPKMQRRPSAAPQTFFLDPDAIDSHGANLLVQYAVGRRAELRDDPVDPMEIDRQSRQWVPTAKRATDVGRRRSLSPEHRSSPKASSRSAPQGLSPSSSSVLRTLRMTAAHNTARP